MTAMIDDRRTPKRPSPCICRAGCELPVVRGVSFQVERRRMRGAVRSLRRRQILDPENDLRQLPLRRRPDRHPPRGRGDRPRHGRAAAGPRACAAPPSAMSASSCARCRGLPTIDVVAEPLIASGRGAGGGARAGRERCCAASTFPSGCGRCRHRPSPAASSSASTSRAASFPTCRSCCSTSRPPRSMPPIAPWWSSLIDEKKRAGVAMVAIVHDDEIRHLIADRIVDVTSFAAAA